jgi:AMMECR1 domain-containing protein
MNAPVKLAKTVAEYYVKTQTVPVLSTQQPTELLLQRACYVYLYQKPGQRLRAVFGRPLPQYNNLAQEITAHTIAAISQYKHITIRRADLSSISYSVAVLEAVQRINDYHHLDPHRYGLYLLSDQGKTSVILPQRPGIETAQDQFATALRESGINLRQEAITLYRFGVQYYE